PKYISLLVLSVALLALSACSNPTPPEAETTSPTQPVTSSQTVSSKAGAAHSRGDKHFNASEWSEAIVDYSEVIAEGADPPRLASAYFSRGLCRFALEQ